ncbi:CCA tRNA nucleotidyltransferase [Hyphomonas sp.]|uniref:CCA tRNA nucleotidyltransferase n=1 Tax=Hyphomonas sp. TaxID=87 RepID=UPI0026200E94|nr:CCA tRNA nucleotidyltransferase [Hyphomonas sp.]
MTRPDRITADWLTAPASRAVMAALEAARKDASRYVGGSVRNTLQGLKVEDVDIATQLLPEETVAALEAASIRVIPTGIDHGTVTAFYKGVPIEITTLRRDVETDGRRAVVAFTQDWAEDAARRDFRMNAIYAGPEGALYEVIPGSVEDAIAGRVIFIGEGDQRLIEDYLRILRFYRFNAWYGAGIDEAGQGACARQRAGLTKIAAERIWKELKRTLAAPDPAPAMLAMEEAGVLEVILPAASAALLSALISAEAVNALRPDPMQRLMALLPRRQREVSEAANALRLSNQEAARLQAWADPALGHVLALGPAARREAFYRYTPQAVLDRALIEAASGGEGTLAPLLEDKAHWMRPVFPVGGQHALAAGLKGPDIGKRLYTLEQAWIASGFRLSREDLISRLK